jgi:hypothetical protein
MLTLQRRKFGRSVTTTPCGVNRTGAHGPRKIWTSWHGKNRLNATRAFPTNDLGVLYAILFWTSFCCASISPDIRSSDRRRHLLYQRRAVRETGRQEREILLTCQQPEGVVSSHVPPRFIGQETADSTGLPRWFSRPATSRFESSAPLVYGCRAAR